LVTWGSLAQVCTPEMTAWPQSESIGQQKTLSVFGRTHKCASLLRTFQHWWRRPIMEAQGSRCGAFCPPQNALLRFGPGLSRLCLSLAVLPLTSHLPSRFCPFSSFYQRRYIISCSPHPPSINLDFYASYRYSLLATTLSPLTTPYQLTRPSLCLARPINPTTTSEHNSASLRSQSIAPSSCRHSSIPTTSNNISSKAPIMARLTTTTADLAEPRGYQLATTLTVNTEPRSPRKRW
jgi:hypothetical protein